MVEDGVDLAPRALLLVANRIEIALEDLDQRRALLLRDHLCDVERVHVRAAAVEVLCDLLTLDQQKPPRLGEARSVLAQAPESHRKRLARTAFLHFRVEACLVLRIRLPTQPCRG